MNRSDESLAEVRVLVVHEDGGLLESLRRALADAHRVTACESAKRALAMIESGVRFDVLVTDLTSTDLGGRELHSRLVSIDPVLARNMLLLAGGRLSAADEDFLDDRRFRALLKPFTAERLREEVHALAARASLVRLAALG